MRDHLYPISRYWKRIHTNFGLHSKNIMINIGQSFSRSMAQVVSTSPYELQIYRRIQFCSAQNLLQASVLWSNYSWWRNNRKAIIYIFLSNRFLQLQYRQRNYAEYFDLIHNLLQVEEMWWALNKEPSTTPRRGSWWFFVKSSSHFFYLE